MKLKKCPAHHPILYTLRDICQQCKRETKDAHYKFIKISNTNSMTFAD